VFLCRLIVPSIQRAACANNGDKDLACDGIDLPKTQNLVSTIFPSRLRVHGRVQFVLLASYFARLRFHISYHPSWRFLYLTLWDIISPIVLLRLIARRGDLSKVSTKFWPSSHGP